MDYTKQLSDIEAGLAARTSTIAQATGEQTALQAAHDIITVGYQSDADAIAAAVATQVGDVQTANATLTAQVADLTSQLGTANSTISSITTILANLGYNSDGTPIA